MKSNAKLLKFVSITSVMHMLVDGLCVCTLYMMFNSFDMPDAFIVFLAYNVIAFTTQPFTGMIVDKFKNMHWVVILSAFLLALAVLLASVVISYTSLHSSFTALLFVSILLGLGNSLFHVWGGKQVVVKAGNDMRPLGVFVSTGAFGLALGFVFCSWTILYLFLMAICILAFTYILLDTKSPVIEHVLVANDPPSKISSKTAWVWLSIIAIAAFVMLRSYVGEDFSSYIQKNSTIMLLLGAVGMFGKMAGGWIAKWFGIFRSMAVILVVVLICFIFRASGGFTPLMGLFAMNLTMPVTLYLANYVLKGREGLAFGILAAALIPGYYLAHY